MAKEKATSNYADYTVFQQSNPLKLPGIFIPKDLLVAMQIIKAPFTYPLSTKCENYVKSLKSLFKLKNIEKEHYFSILKMCLYVEQNEIDIELNRQRLINHDVKITNDFGECFIINMPNLNTDKPIIMPDDKVVLYEVVTRREIPAIVVAVVGHEVKVRLFNPRDSSLLQKNKKFDINFHSQHWPLRCCHYALMINSKRKWTQILYPELRAGYMHLKYDIDEWLNPNVAKNEEQKQAVRSILNKTAYPAPYIIFGPPGTGKTSTLVEAICQILNQHPMEYILVCAGSNAAADEVTKRLLQYVPKNIVYRMYATSRLWSNVDPKIRPCANYVDQSTIFLPKNILLLKKVIITTLVTSIRLISKNFHDNHFSYIFIDEASQATEPEMLIPLSVTSDVNKLASTTLHAQLVIAGDPYQLGPIVRSKQIQQIYGTSMLERLMRDCTPYKKQNGRYNSNYITKLLENYRNHECFLHIPNNEFYENELKTCGGSDTQIGLNWSELPNKNFPMIFQEVVGKEERCANRSVFNEVEVLVTVKYVQMLVGKKLGDRKLAYKDIGIITPFKQQQLEIIHQLAMNKQEDITVGTVETFQGQERTVIILSTVRSEIFNHDGVEHIGFLSHPKRFNVALTRAKALMIIIGNPEVIGLNKYWRQLWDYCRENGSCIPFNRCPLSSYNISRLISNKRIDPKDYNAPDKTKLSVTVQFGRNNRNSNMRTRTLDNVLVRTMKNLAVTDD